MKVLGAARYECRLAFRRSRRGRKDGAALPLAKENRAPRGAAGPDKNWNGEGFLKPSRNNEALTTPSVYPRTGGVTSV